MELNRYAMMFSELQLISNKKSIVHQLWPVHLQIME